MERLNNKYQPKLLEFTPEAGEILRQKCRELSREEILSPEIQNLIEDMKYTVEESKRGVGLSANQVGRREAISVVAIKPTPARPNLERFEKVCINPKIVKTFGEPTPMWEGCMSTATDENGESSMGLVPRYKKIEIDYFDEHGSQHNEEVEGFIAHVMQHETDHLNGVLFTDLIDKNSLISYQEYIDRFAKQILKMEKPTPCGWVFVCSRMVGVLVLFWGCSFKKLIKYEVEDEMH